MSRNIYYRMYGNCSNQEQQIGLCFSSIVFFLGFKMPFAVNYLQSKTFYALKLDLYECLLRYVQFRLCHFQWNFESGGISFMKLFVGTVIQNKSVDIEKV